MDESQVLVLLTPEGKCYHAGDPKTFDVKAIVEAKKDGHTIKTVSLTDFHSIQWCTKGEWPRAHKKSKK